MTKATCQTSRNALRMLAGALVIGTCLSTLASAAEPTATGEFVDRIYKDEHGSHKYVVFVPAGYTPDKSYPAILWLHGASARGRDGRAPLVAGLGPNVFHRRSNLPFLAVFPQCENLDSRLLGGWTDDRDDVDRAMKILADAEKNYRIDPKRRILAGVSMGAFGTWSLASRTADHWSAVIAVSGGGPIELTDHLTKVPVWAFHAADDQVVPTTASTSLVDAIRAKGGAAYYSELPNGGHNIGSRVFAKDEVYDWLLNPSRPPRPPEHWQIDRTVVSQLQNEVRFVPGGEMDRAVTVHIGADLLKSLATALPGQVPPNALQGARGAETQQTGSGWNTFQVTVAGVQYAGQVQTARMEPLPDNQLRIAIGMQPLTMTVLGTEIQGRLLRAQAGPMQVVIGANRPAWLNIVVRPKIEARRLRMELISADFPIENDNWYVTEPNGVDTFPLPILRDRISQRLTEGLYAKRGEISQQVVAGVPQMLKQLEDRTDGQWDRVITFGRWPMPVWQPRAKFWPSEITISDAGIGISLGVTMAALAPPSDQIPIMKFAGPKSKAEIATGGLQMSIAKDAVTAWTTLLATSDVRRFHVNDFHDSAFHRLAEREFLALALPGLIDVESTAQLKSVLSFEQPMYLEAAKDDVTRTNDDAVLSRAPVRFGGRELRLTISERADMNHPWQPLAEFPLTWSQEFDLTTRKISHRRRQLGLESVRPAKLESSGRCLASTAMDQPVNHELIAAQFRRGWEATFAKSLSAQTVLPERVVAQVPLTWDAIELKGEHLVLRLSTPTTQIRNLSREPMTYEVRTGESEWSPQHVLAPGMMHSFPAAGPLFWRGQIEGREFQYQLPVGSVSQFRGDAKAPLSLVTE